MPYCLVVLLKRRWSMIFMVRATRKTRVTRMMLCFFGGGGGVVLSVRERLFGHVRDDHVSIVHWSQSLWQWDAPEEVQARAGLRVAVRHGELQVGREDGDPVDQRGALEGVHQPFC